MFFRPHPACLLAPLLLVSSAHAVVEDWFMDKGIIYRQSADDSQPTVPAAWTVEVGVETTNPGDFNSATISRVGSAVVHTLNFEAGEWVFEEDYDSEADMNLAFPSSNNYKITLTGGTLGPKSQTFTLGPAIYPNVPYLTGSDFTRAQSFDATENFAISWNSPDGVSNGAALDIEESINDSFYQDYEYDILPLATSQVLVKNTLIPGYCYEGDLIFLNAVEASGAPRAGDIGGFGIEGYIEHASILIFELQTVLSRTPQAIVGAWQFGNGAANESGVLVFQANGVYFLAEDAEGTEQDDIETGTYTWDSNSGALTATPIVDENGDHGLSHPDGSDIITIDGDILYLTDNSETSQLQRVGFNPSSWIEGGWRLCDNSGADKGVLVFLANGIYFHAELAEPGDLSETNGIERGTYNWNSSSGVLTTTISVDTNLESGLSNPLVAPDIVSFPGPRVLGINDSEQSYLHRITNASVVPDWRLNKGRSYNQSANNTVPNSVLFWDVYAQVETLNGTDATQITLSGGGLAAPLNLIEEDPGEWTYDKDYTSQGLLDAEFPNGQTYTITISGGELGTITQEINTGSGGYPVVPFLTGSTFTDAQAIDPTADFDFDWSHPTGATVNIVVTDMPGEEGTEFFNELIFGGSSEGTTLPALSMPAGQTGYGYLEFSTDSIRSDGAGGFGASGLSGRQSITFDFPVNAQSGADLVDNAAATAGLSGPAAEMDATPFSDGVENILKYAFNMNLSAADTSSLESGTGSSGLPVFAIDGSGPSPVFKVEFIRRKGSGLVYTAKRSSSLGDGTFAPMTGGVTVTPIPGNEQFERVVVTEPCDPATVPRCFGIVEVTAP